LITEFYGESEAELKHKVGRLIAQLQANGVPNGEIFPAYSKGLQANVWKVRKVGLGLLMSIKGDYKPIPFIEDAAVPPEHLAEYISRIERFCNDLGTDVAYYAHASAGCLHVRPLINAKIASDIEKLPQIVAFSVELLGQYKGSLSSEHGDGRARSWINRQFFGDELYGLYRQVKQTFDPHNLLNPGNIVDAPPMTENLRYGTAYQLMPLLERLDFSSDQGFHRAVEMCNGAGVCRKQTADTMCPTFQVTREELHSTRGRANLLRVAMSGKLPSPGSASPLTSPAIKEALDLCISCKACKAECPSSVDMAKIKFEWQGHYYAERGTPLRARLFGQIAALSRWSSGPLAPLANWGMGLPPLKWALDRFLGISAERELPAFAPIPFTTWFRQREKETRGRGEKGKVVLFNDTFNTYNDPHIAIAATEVLEAAGFEVLLPGHGCCGRPMISKGLIEGARAAARDTIDKLAPFAAQGIPIVGLEPSCLLSFRDEYGYLLPDDPRVVQVAAQSLLFEEFMAQLAAEGKLNLRFKPEAKHYLLHGHCHQKALVGTEPSKKTLTLAPDAQVTEVDSGCCGMAGSFGYEKEHLAWSQAMGERRLMPAIRQADDTTLIAAAGTSCRHQIAHATGKRAYHPAELLRQALADS